AEVFPVDPLEAGRIVWLDALTVNVDRTVHSSNLMIWPTLGTVPPRLWLIDHGAALVFHHRWEGLDPRRRYDFRHHALGSYGPDVRAADAELAPRVTEELLRSVVARVPDAWLADEPGFATPDAARDAYVGPLLPPARASAEGLPTDFPDAEELAAENARRADCTRRGRPDWLKRVPAAWLAAEPGFATPAAAGDAYVGHLLARARASAEWLPTDFPDAEELGAENARRADRTRRGRPDWLKQVPDLHGKPAARQDWS